MRRIFALLLSIGMCLCLIPVKTMAAGGFQEGDFTYTMITGDTLRVDSYQGQNADVVIPDKVVHSGDTYTVTEIKSEAFAGTALILSVTISDTVTTIGHAAFAECINLESVKLSKNLTGYLYLTFYSCPSLKTIDVPSGVDTIDWSTFRDCTSLTTVTLHQGLKTISVNAFAGCKSLSSINIPESVTTIDWYCFMDCKSLESITFPMSVTNFGGQIFLGCTNLKSIICEAAAVPAVDSSDLYGLAANTIDVYVGSGSVEAYKADSNWNCQNIKPLSGVGGSMGFIYRLYQKALGRSPDSEGAQNWYNALKVGTSGADCARGFFYSPEFLSKNLSNEAFVELLYNVFLDRSSDPSGKAGWVASLNSGTSRSSVIDGFVNSVEWANVCRIYGIVSGGNAVATVTVEPSTTITDFATRLYNITLNRNPDPQGLENWSEQLANMQITGTQAAYGFFMSPEFVNSNYSNEEYVTRLYNAFLGRDPDASGFANWVDALNSGSSRESVFYGFANSNEFSGICISYGIRR